MTGEPNRPTPMGRALGATLGRLTDVEMALQLREFPRMRDDRCKSCAFRTGTLPNGCEETVLDALTCVLTTEPFYCHLNMHDGKPTRICDGWLAAIGATTRVVPGPELMALANTWKEKRGSVTPGGMK